MGYVKTGTTYLQQTVFANAELGFELVGGTQNRALLVNWFRAHNDYDFDAAALSAEMRALENKKTINWIEAAQVFFAKSLFRDVGRDARAYLKSRGLTGEDCKRFGIPPQLRIVTL